MNNGADTSLTILNPMAEHFDAQTTILEMLQLVKQQQLQIQKILSPRSNKASYSIIAFPDKYAEKEDERLNDEPGPDMQAGLSNEQMDDILVNGPKFTIAQLLKDGPDVNRLELVTSPSRKGFLVMAPNDLFEWSREAYRVFNEAIKMSKITIEGMLNLHSKDDERAIWTQRLEKLEKQKRVAELYTKKIAGAFEQYESQSLQAFSSKENPTDYVIDLVVLKKAGKFVC